MNEEVILRGVDEKSCMLIVLHFRPLSVDSLNGGSPDALKKAPVEKKIGLELSSSLKSRFEFRIHLKSPM